MKKIIYILLTNILLLYMLTGCWDSREVSDLAIAGAISIDSSENGYLVSVQLINPGEIAFGAATSRTAITTYHTKAETIFEALRKLTLKTPQKVYLAHVRVIVIGEELARQGIGKVLDLFLRDHEIRSDFYIVIAKGSKAKEVLDVITPLEKIPAIKLFSSLEISSKAWAETTVTQLDDVIASITSDGKNAVITGVYVKGDYKEGMDISNVEKVEAPATIQITSSSVFKGDKLVGWLRTPESKGYNYIIGEVSNTVFSVFCEENTDAGKLTVELLRTKSSIKGKVESGVPSINVELVAEANIGEVACDVDLSKPETITKFEKKISKQIKKVMVESVQMAQNVFKSDIFGFGEAIHRADPKEWKKLKKNWSMDFAKLEVNIKVDAKIRRIGTITESYQGDIKE